MGVLISVQSELLQPSTEQPKSADRIIAKRNSSVSPASTQECVLAVQMAHWTGMEAIEWNVLDGRANLSVLTAAEGHVITARQVVAGDLQR
jgi:hypothetical protein